MEITSRIKSTLGRCFGTSAVNARQFPYDRKWWSTFDATDARKADECEAMDRHLQVEQMKSA